MLGLSWLLAFHAVVSAEAIHKGTHFTQEDRALLLVEGGGLSSGAMFRMHQLVGCEIGPGAAGSDMVEELVQAIEYRR